jgi:hypothetical protein
VAFGSLNRITFLSPVNPDWGLLYKDKMDINLKRLDGEKV